MQKLVENFKPLLPIGSPIDFGGGHKEQARAFLHLAFICELYGFQVRRGRYFLHRHSHSADSWNLETIVDSMNRFPDTFQKVTDSCKFGPNNLGKAMQTLTRRLTNSGCVAQALSKPTTCLACMCQTITDAMSQHYNQTCMSLRRQNSHNIVRLCRIWIFWEAEDGAIRSRTDLSATLPLEALRVLLCVAGQEDFFRVERPLLDLN